MYIPFEAVTITPLKHNRKILSRFSLQNQMFCVCILPAVKASFYTQCRYYSVRYPEVAIFEAMTTNWLTGRFAYGDFSHHLFTPISIKCFEHLQGM